MKPVEKIFGPGNRFVVEAKRQLVGAVAIDLLPGPSEVMVLADDTADAEFLAADLLAQGEHGPDSVVVFVTTSEALLEQVDAEVERQAALLSRGSIIREVLDKHAYGFLVSSIQEGWNWLMPLRRSIWCLSLGMKRPYLMASGRRAPFTQAPFLL